SCSLMVGEPAAVAAARASRGRPSLAVGLHLTVVQGRAVLPPNEIPRLVDREGRFRDDPVRAGLRYAFDRRGREQLARELRAQFERFGELGLPIAHFDGHLHMHMHPVVFDLAAGLADEAGCRAVRIPRDDWWGYRREEGLRALTQAPLAAIF